MTAYSQAGSIPSCPASCRCGQLRTDHKYPAVRFAERLF
nr:MAG TPA: Leucine-rich glioma-inactivated protein [Caudoviricetes sp.]